MRLVDIRKYPVGTEFAIMERNPEHYSPSRRYAVRKAILMYVHARGEKSLKYRVKRYTNPITLEYGGGFVGFAEENWAGPGWQPTAYTPKHVISTWDQHMKLVNFHEQQQARENHERKVKNEIFKTRVDWMKTRLAACFSLEPEYAPKSMNFDQSVKFTIDGVESILESAEQLQIELDLAKNLLREGGMMALFTEKRAEHLRMLAELEKEQD